MKSKIETFLKEREIKVTANRILILELFLDSYHSLSIADVEEALPWADRATIFRTLKTFEEKALLHTIKDDDKSVKYALCLEDCKILHHKAHPHFHCDICGKTYCLPEYDFQLPDLPKNYTVNHYSLIINGVCENCQNKSNEK